MQRPVVPPLDDPSVIDELMSAICSVQDREDPGRDSIPSEV